ncbi:hypothetical protein XELAEV_18031434mg [Xenopus laevis]|uniref:Uncharacterized protein n=1 Tax=Xenopus laevis TaxID=8355 RepID=A0A974CP80_XENLA|nr:hypothetical protein XELAEV_18031434mg [Xenopus laevis]
MAQTGIRPVCAVKCALIKSNGLCGLYVCAALMIAQSAYFPRDRVTMDTVPLSVGVSGRCCRRYDAAVQACQVGSAWAAHQVPGLQVAAVEDSSGINSRKCEQALSEKGTERDGLPLQSCSEQSFRRNQFCEILSFLVSENAMPEAPASHRLIGGSPCIVLMIYHSV